MEDSNRDETHRCCGKTLTVAAVSFTDATLNDVFGQLSESARRSRDEAAQTRDGGEDLSLFRRRFPPPGYFEPNHSYRVLYGDNVPRSALSYEEGATGQTRPRSGRVPPHGAAAQMFESLKSVIGTASTPATRTIPSVEADPSPAGASVTGRTAAAWTTTTIPSPVEPKAWRE